MATQSPAAIAAPVETEEQRGYRRFFRTVMLLVGLGFLALIASGVAVGIVMVRSEDQARWVEHTYEVEQELTGIRMALERMRSARRGLLLQIPGVERRQLDEGARALDAAITEVGRLSGDNPAQQARVRALRALSVEIKRAIGGSIQPGATEQQAEERVRQSYGVALERLLRDMARDEDALLRQRQAAQEQSVQTFYLVLSIAGVLLVIVATGSVLVIVRFARDLSAARDRLRQLNEGLEVAVQERTVDLQRANDEIQRFAYIVSHDLRSPLVNVMGFTAELEAATKPLRALVERAEAEAPGLVSQDARAAALEDLPESIGFIRGSTQKMDRLINAILRLSREGRRVVTPERIDMGALVQGVVDSVTHRTEELGAEIHVAGPLPVVTSDRLAVEQILSNLIENALKYLRPGVPGRIRVSGRREGGRALFEITDNGRGIDPRDHDRIFDLFRRSGVQDQPGEGIGLAHVRAQAYRIGGTISVDSRLGEGATFIVNLPVVFAGGQGATS